MERIGLCGNIIVNPKLSVIGTGECKNIICDPQNWIRMRQLDLDYKGILWHEPEDAPAARRADLQIHAESTTESLLRATRMLRKYEKGSPEHDKGIMHLGIFKSRLDEIEHQRRK